MHNTGNFDQLTSGLINLIGFLNSPQRDEALLREAGVNLDRALFPLLVRLAAQDPPGVGELADQVGRDATTVSRQLSKLQNLGLIERRADKADRRRNAAQITASGKSMVRAITQARRRILAKVLADWSEKDRVVLARSVSRFSESLTRFARENG